MFGLIIIILLVVGLFAALIYLWIQLEDKGKRIKELEKENGELQRAIEKKGVAFIRESWRPDQGGGSNTNSIFFEILRPNSVGKPIPAGQCENVMVCIPPKGEGKAYFTSEIESEN